MLLSNKLTVETHGINEYNDVVFDISDKEYNLFTASAEIEEKETEAYSYRFIVLVDDEVRFISLLYDKNNGLLPVHADISGGKRLILRVIKQY